MKLNTNWGMSSHGWELVEPPDPEDTQQGWEEHLATVPDLRFYQEQIPLAPEPPEQDLDDMPASGVRATSVTRIVPAGLAGARLRRG